MTMPCDGRRRSSPVTEPTRSGLSCSSRLANGVIERRRPCDPTRFDRHGRVATAVARCVVIAVPVTSTATQRSVVRHETPSNTPPFVVTVATDHDRPFHMAPSPPTAQ